MVLPIFECTGISHPFKGIDVEPVWFAKQCTFCLISLENGMNFTKILLNINIYLSLLREFFSGQTLGYMDIG